MKHKQIRAPKRTFLYKLKMLFKPRARHVDKFMTEARQMAHERKSYFIVQADPETDLITISYKDKVWVGQMDHRYVKKAVKYQHTNFADYLLHTIDTAMQEIASITKGRNYPIINQPQGKE